MDIWLIKFLISANDLNFTQTFTETFEIPNKLDYKLFEFSKSHTEKHSTHMRKHFDIQLRRP